MGHKVAFTSSTSTGDGGVAAMYGIDNIFTMETTSDIIGCTGFNGGCIMMGGSGLNQFYSYGDGLSG